MSFVTIQNLSGEVFTIPTYNGFTAGNLLVLAYDFTDSPPELVRLYDSQYEMVRDLSLYPQNGERFYIVVLDEDEPDFYDYYEQAYELEMGFD
jgi:hypothetical protein